MSKRYITRDKDGFIQSTTRVIEDSGSGDSDWRLTVIGIGLMILIALPVLVGGR